MDERERRWSAALAGLLHDIGKIEQRARTDPWNPAPDTDRDGQPVHATWTTYFAEQYLPDRYKAIGLHAAYHHVPDRSPAQERWISEVVALADKLSAGERADQSEQNSSRRPPRQLVTIFDRLTLDATARPARAEHYLPLKPLALSENVLFAGEARSDEAQGNAYEALRVELESAARQDDGDIETYLENFAASLQHTAWCVPSAYYHSVPDISLYDHARMTAALAACLADLPLVDVQRLLAAVKRDFQGAATNEDAAVLDRKVALLIGGDISGVQDFIYTLTSKNAAKTLRGRSFYLQLLTEAVLRYVLRELGIPYTSVIYSGGGHFYLLAPLSAVEKLPAIRAYVTRTLLTHHGTGLYLALGETAVPASGFKGSRFKDYWSQMHLELGKIKQRRYVELGDDLYSGVFEPVSHGGNREQPCSVCGVEAEKTFPLDDDDDEERICALCASFGDDIGAKLPGRKFVALGLCKPQPTTRGTAFDALRALGLAVTLEQNLKFTEKVERAVIWALDDLAENERWPSLSGIPTSRVMRYTVNLVPEVRDSRDAERINQLLWDHGQRDAVDRALVGQIKTFNHLQVEAHGIDHLGVLRMDVDNLGDLFKDGFGADRATLSRISTLSFQLSLFFEGWVKRLCEKYENLIYAVYAGGDDVFLIGPWDVMPQLAVAISDDLIRYAGHNPNVHISAGLTFIHGKYPVYQAAEDAHEALEQAKHIDDKKNAVSFLGQTWHWDEFKQVIEKYESLLKVVGKPQAEERGLDGPQAILQTLRQLAQDEAEKADSRGRPVWGPWMWHGAYQFTRMAEREKRQPELSQELSAIRDELSANDYGDINQWGAAARWAQLWLRKT